MGDHTQHSELFKGQLSIHYMLSLFPAVTHDMSATCILYYYIIKKRIIIIIKFTDPWNHTVHNNKLSLTLCFFQRFHSCFTITPIVPIISRLAVGCLNVTWCTCWPWTAWEFSPLLCCWVFMQAFAKGRFVLPPFIKIHLHIIWSFILLSGINFMKVKCLEGFAPSL